MEEFVHEDCMVSSTDLQYQNQNHNQNTPALRRVFPPSTTDANSRAAARATRARDGLSTSTVPGSCVILRNSASAEFILELQSSLYSDSV